MKQIVKKLMPLIHTGFFHIFGSSVINKILSFFSSIILVQILSKTEYGVFTYAWNIYSIILLFNGMGIDAGMLQMSSEHSGDQSYAEKVGKYCMRFGVKFDLLLGALIMGIALFAPLKIEGSQKLICILCFLPMVQLLYQITISYLRSLKKNKEYATVSVMNTACVLVVSAGAAFLFREIGLVIGYYVAYGCSFLFASAVFGVHLFRYRAVLIPSERTALLKISFISMLNSGLSQLMYLVDVFVLGVVDPQETILASYKVATMIPSALVFVPLSLITYIYPYFAEHRNDGEWCIMRSTQTLLVLGSANLIISSMLFLMAPWIICVLFGDQYLDALPIFKILAVNYFISGTFRILSGNLLVTQRKLKFNLFVAVVSSSINIIADYFFIQWWGALGAAYATVLVVLVSSFLSTIYLIHTLKETRNRNLGRR